MITAISAEKAMFDHSAGMRAFRLDPRAVANAVRFALEQPSDVEIGDLAIRPTVQS